jgi:TM2 domain-containing membrane protein YozV
MSSSKPTEPPPPPVKLDFVAAFLSYLIPGLGQLTQGRVRKGLLYLISLYALFFYGMYLGSFKNVYLPDYHPNEPTVNRLASDLYTRFQFVGQFPIGMAAWPAVYQYVVYDPHDDASPPLHGCMRAPSMDEINRLQRDGDKTWDLGWVYTVIAGVLNVLVIYDALAGPAFREIKAAPPQGAPTS